MIAVEVLRLRSFLVMSRFKRDQKGGSCLTMRELGTSVYFIAVWGVREGNVSIQHRFYQEVLVRGDESCLVIIISSPLTAKSLLSMLEMRKFTSRTEGRSLVISVE